MWKTINISEINQNDNCITDDATITNTLRWSYTKIIFHHSQKNNERASESVLCKIPNS